MHPWRERLARWFTPLALRAPLSPNQITVLGTLMNVIAAFLLLFSQSDPRLFLGVPVLVGIGGLLDAFDGIVARARGMESAFGDYLDHFLDRVSDLAIMAGWILGTGVRAEIGFPALIMVMLNGYAGTQIEATFRVRSYEGAGRAEFVLVMVSFPVFAFILARMDMLFASHWGMTIPEWLTIVLATGATLGIVTRTFRARSLDRT